MASGMRLIVSCISSFLILSLLLFMVHRLRQRRRERIETLISGNRKTPADLLSDLNQSDSTPIAHDE